MFSNSKVRTIVAGSLALVALAAPQVASATTAASKPVAGATAATAPKILFKEVGGAIYDDATCQSLAHDSETAVNYGYKAHLEGDNETALRYVELSNTIDRQISENCLTVD